MKETWLFRDFLGDELLPSYIWIMLPSLYRKGLSSSKMNHPFFNGHLFLHPKPKGALFPEHKNRGARPENTPVCTDTFSRKQKEVADAESFRKVWKFRCCWGLVDHGQSTYPPQVPYTPPPRNKGLIAGLIKGNQWFISPDHKALFLGGLRYRGVG